jgi:electron transport complex protein RnfG
MYRAMVGVGLLCGLLIVSVYQLTRPVIERKKAAALEQAILQVLPEATTSTTFRLGDDERFTAIEGAPGDDDRVVHAGYDDGGRLVGLAIEARGMGYQDVIVVLYGYAFELDAVIGVRVLESRETPGLGTRIETDPEFLENFRALDVTVADDGAALAHRVEGVKHGRKEHPWQVDGITGATISSMALADMLGESTGFWIPRVRRRLDDFRKAG